MPTRWRHFSADIEHFFGAVCIDFGAFQRLGAVVEQNLQSGHAMIMLFSALGALCRRVNKPPKGAAPRNDTTGEGSGSTLFWRFYTPG